MKHNGNVLPIPDEYTESRVARFLGVPPWELRNRPIEEFHWALTIMAAEDKLRQHQEAEHQRRAKR